MCIRDSIIAKFPDGVNTVVGKAGVYLSGGERQRIALARAILKDAPIVVLDEATAGLDPMARDEVLDILRSFIEDENHAILISTHITSDLEKIADEVICIEDGHMVFDLPKDAICDEAGIAHCRIADLEGLMQDGRISDSSFALQRGMSTDVLVSDRFAFARDYPGIPVDRASIEDYMTLALKGEPLKEVQ